MISPALLPTGTITFLFTDIEGSTRLWETSPELMRAAVARHDALLRQAVEQNHGTVVKNTGDGIAAAFAVAPDALAAALAAQQALLGETWAEPIVVRSRMALHTGAAEWRDGDYFGTTLNRCARLMAAGHGGQILLSDATQELTCDALPEGATLVALGGHRLKDLARPETIFQLAHPTLPGEFPPLRTLDTALNNLPQQVTSFIGREKQLQEVTALLGQSRLLTLTGAGGSGKTRLSLQVAADLLEQYPDGVWFVELAPLSEPALVPRTVALVLGLREMPGQSLLETLTDFLKAKRILLLLDNCEHLISACAELATALLRSCPNVTLLATSREPLGVRGEQTYRVPSLSLPDVKQSKAVTAITLSQYESVRLFIDRAGLVKTDFAITDANAPAVAQVCYRLDGIPLALELAAARVRSLPVEQINDRLDHRFRLLTGGDRSALPRQQTLRALIDWSYDLLTDSEKTLLARLSRFAGGWTLDAAERVCGFAPIEEWEVLDLLTSLADKSLLLVDEEAGASRYRMLETVRQYSGEKLVSRGEADALRERHRDFFVHLGEEAQAKLVGPEQAAWLNRLESEHDNLRAALDSCAAGAVTGRGAAAKEAAVSGLRLSGALWNFWMTRGYLGEGRERLNRALSERRAILAEGEDAPDAAVTKKVLCGALRGAGNMAYSQGDYAAARSLYEEGLVVLREIDDKAGIAATLSNLGTVAQNQGNYAAARPLHEESLSVFREIGGKRGIATALACLGNLSADQGDNTAAQPLLEESLVLYREIGDKGRIATVLLSLATVTYYQGDYATSRRLNEESLSVYREIGDKRGIAITTLHLGNTTSRQGEFAAARPLLEEALSLFREIGDKRGVGHTLEVLGFVLSLQGDKGAALSLLAESLSVLQEIGDKRGIASGLAHVAAVCADDEPRRALVLWAAARAVRESIVVPLPPPEQAEVDGGVARARAVLDEVIADEAWTEGLALGWEQAVELALEGEH